MQHISQHACLERALMLQCVAPLVLAQGCKGSMLQAGFCCYAADTRQELAPAAGYQTCMHDSSMWQCMH